MAHCIGSRPLLNVNKRSLQQLEDSLRRQAADLKFNVFFSNCCHYAKGIASLHRHTKPLLQPKGFFYFSLVTSLIRLRVSDMSTAEGLSVHTSCLYRDRLNPESLASRPPKLHALLIEPNYRCGFLVEGTDCCGEFIIFFG